MGFAKALDGQNFGIHAARERSFQATVADIIRVGSVVQEVLNNFVNDSWIDQRTGRSSEQQEIGQLVKVYSTG